MPLTFGFKWCGNIKLGTQGMDGCRNLRDGGDTVMETAGPYFTYLVYQSFKHPPPKGVSLIRSRA